jgi:hypothetical protein
MLFGEVQQRFAVVVMDLGALSLSGELVLLFDPVPAQPTKFLKS